MSFFLFVLVSSCLLFQSPRRYLVLPSFFFGGGGLRFPSSRGGPPGPPRRPWRIAPVRTTKLVECGRSVRENKTAKKKLYIGRQNFGVSSESVCVCVCVCVCVWLLFSLHFDLVDCFSYCRRLFSSLFRYFGLHDGSALLAFEFFGRVRT